VTLVAEGDAALVLHNERLADPLDPVTRAIAAISKKRSKTEADHLEIARLEFLGGLYLNGPAEFDDGHFIMGKDVKPAIPAWNVLRCLQDGATRHKRGKDVLRGCHPLTEFAELHYDGPTDPDLMWKSGDFSLRKTVGVQRARTVRTRPFFSPWSVTLRIEVDPVVFDLDTLAVMWREAGRYAGLGEMRPVYGRFIGRIQ
jgi:hypothetical protein